MGCVSVGSIVLAWFLPCLATSRFWAMGHDGFLLSRVGKDRKSVDICIILYLHLFMHICKCTRCLCGTQSHIRAVSAIYIYVHMCILCVCPLRFAKTCKNMNLKTCMYDSTCILYTSVHPILYACCETKHNAHIKYLPYHDLSISTWWQNWIQAARYWSSLVAPQTKAGNWRRTAAKWCPGPEFAWPHNF